MIVMCVILMTFVGGKVDGNVEFPEDFLFGFGSSAYQVEGGWNASGKSENIWDRHVHAHRTVVAGNATGDVACDSYRLFNDDVRILNDLGANFYRFSISWSRLLPAGYGSAVNPDGLRYYTALLDNLQKNKIMAMVTLYHFDMPQVLQDLGGWANPVVITYFVNYAKLCFRNFAAKVKFWVTFNDPARICLEGFGTAEMPPSVSTSGIGDYLCAKNILLAHAKVYRIYDAAFRGRLRGSLGITLGTPWFEANTNTTSDKVAAEQAMQMEFGWVARPIFSKTGDYPPIMKERIERFSEAENYTCRLPALTRSEVKLIRGASDFMGLNHFTTFLVSGAERPVASTPSHAKDVGVTLQQDSKWSNSSLCRIKSAPWGFKKLLVWIKNEYCNPTVYVTENGFPDKGEIKDHERINYHAGYMKQMLEAITKRKCNVKGYSAWSLMDGFEWRYGYSIKFGIYSVNFKEGGRTRTPKLSYNFFKALIQTREVPALCFELEPPKIGSCV